MPDPSTVASAIALGSFGSLRSASSSHAAKSANGSPVSVKSACVLGASRVMQELYCRPPPFSTPDRFRLDHPGHLCKLAPLV